jgi:protoporphyrin/coproporphyrin ferrochelatase
VSLRHQAVLLIAFGGPNSMDEVRPFLANVLRGRPAPPQRIEEVVHHYEIIGGRSPLNDLTLRQAQALRERLRQDEIEIPVYVGMRNWHPYLRDTLAEMYGAGIRSALGFILSAQQNEAGWDRYMRDVEQARAELGGKAPEVEFTRGWHAHPLFLQAVAERAAAALESVPEARRAAVRLVFTAHSLPITTAASSPYVAQLEEGAAGVAARLGFSSYRLAYQSRSGNPRDPWLEPDIGAVVAREAAAGTRDLLVVPIGFVCDHVEVLYDLDVEARSIAEEKGVHLLRAETVNDHPAFIRMIAEIVVAQLQGRGNR